VFKLKLYPLDYMNELFFFIVCCHLKTNWE